MFTNRIAFQLSYLREHPHLVIDGDTHPTLLHRMPHELRRPYELSADYYQGRPISPTDLLREMDQAGVDMAITWQNPAAMLYTDDPEENYMRLRQANADIFQMAEQHPTRFLPCGWTDPKALGLEYALQLTETCILDWGFPVVKMNPAQNAYPIDSPMVMSVVDRIVELGAVPAFHFGGDSPYTPAEGLRKVAQRHPHRPVIAVHMGGGGSHFVDGDPLYIATRELGLQQPNLFFVLSAIRDCHIVSNLIRYTFAGAPFCHQIACGSDAPYGKIGWSFAGFRQVFRELQDAENHPDPRVRANPGFLTPEQVQGYLGRNLAQLMIGSYERYKAMTMRHKV